MDKINEKWYLATLDLLEIMGFKCVTCANLDNGVCRWAGKLMADYEFCTNWSEKKEIPE